MKLWLQFILLCAAVPALAHAPEPKGIPRLDDLRGNRVQVGSKLPVGLQPAPGESHSAGSGDFLVCRIARPPPQHCGGRTGFQTRSAHDVAPAADLETCATLDADTYLLAANQTLAASYRYVPYGNTTYSSGSLAAVNVYRYSSKEFHAGSGLYYYGYRFYSPNWQRWVNQDPIGECGGLNLYGFVYNDPVNLVDTDGLAALKKLYRVYQAWKRHKKLVAQVREIDNQKAVERVKEALDQIDTSKGYKRVVESPTDEARDYLAKRLSENGKCRGPEKSPGYPEHVHPQKGPYSDTHIQSMLAAAMIPHANRVSNDPNASWFDLGIAGLWDVASTIDPIFLTDGLEAIFDVSPDDF